MSLFTYPNIYYRAFFRRDLFYSKLFVFYSDSSDNLQCKNDIFVMTIKEWSQNAQKLARVLVKMPVSNRLPCGYVKKKST